MAVEYQLHGERNSDIFRFQRHKESLEDPKFASVLWCLYDKNEKRCACGTCTTDSRYPERMGNIIYCITFPEPKKTEQNVPKHSPQSQWRWKRFLVVILILSLRHFHLLRQNINVILCFSKKCCQFSNFVARFSEFSAPFETFFKSLGKNIATSWTNLIQVLILPTELHSSFYRSVNLPLWCNLVTFSYFQLKAVGNTVNVSLALTLKLVSPC